MLELKIELIFVIAVNMIVSKSIKSYLRENNLSGFAGVWPISEHLA